VNIKSSKIFIGYASAIIAAALFGSVSTLAKPILNSINPIVLSALVYILAGITFSCIGINTKFNLEKKYFILILISAVVGAAIAPSIFFLGLKNTTASDTALIANGETVFSIMFALVIFKERLQSLGYISLVVVLVGLLMVSTDFKQDSTIFKWDSGNMLVLVATIIWGLDNNIARLVLRRINVSRFIQLKSLIGGSILFVTILILNVPIDLARYQILPIIVLGIFGFALSLFLYLHSIKRIGVVKSSLILSLSAVFGLVFSAVFLKEPVSIIQLVAITIMLFGILLMYSTESNIAFEL
jgi:drug/metabolite transporter (DMT)-like permease